MYKCTKCGELLGDNVRICFRCHHEISSEEIEEIKDDNEKMNVEMEWQARADYEHRWKKTLIASGIFFVVMMILIPLCVNASNDAMFLIPLLAVTIIFIAYCLKQRAYRCPFCDLSMGRRNFWDRYCPRCGKQYRN